MIKIHDNLGAFFALGPTEKAFFFLVPVSNFMHMGGVWGICTGIDIQIYWCGYYMKLHVQGCVWYIIYDSRIVVADVKRNRFYATVHTIKQQKRAVGHLSHYNKALFVNGDFYVFLI